jgi:putative SOS response-associated peptidase YedK
MCGRYTLVKSAEEIAQRFKLEEIDPRLKSTYNAAPTQLLPVITADSPEGLSWFYWGLIPAWSKNKAVSQKLINARAETVDQKASFKRALQARRCLVPADGFYEWKVLGKKTKVPYRIHLAGNELFAFASLWEEYEDDGGDVVHTFTIITTEANSKVASIHDRMPVILNKQDEKTWLNKNTDKDDLLALLKPYPADKISSYTVSSEVNSPANNRPSLINPAPPTDQHGNYTLFG